MVTIYQADVWCDDCGRAIREDLLRQRKLPSYWNPEEVNEALQGNDQRLLFDSDDWPSIGHPAEPTDSPQHCGANDDCLNAIELSDRKVGAMLGDELTEEGVEYVRDAIRAGEGCPEVLALWAEHFINYF